jgi:hypothetical protein
MQNNSSSDDLKKSTTLGWKFVGLVAGITTIFFTFLYLAMSSEPDYMPNRPPKVTVQPEAVKSTPPTAPSNSAE